MERGTMFGPLLIAIERQRREMEGRSREMYQQKVAAKRKQAEEFVTALANTLEAIGLTELPTLADIPLLDRVEVGVFYRNGPYTFRPTPEEDAATPMFRPGLIPLELIWPDGSTHQFYSAEELVILIEMTNRVWELERTLVKANGKLAEGIGA